MTATLASPTRAAVAAARIRLGRRARLPLLAVVVLVAGCRAGVVPHPHLSPPVSCVKQHNCEENP